MSVCCLQSPADLLLLSRRFPGSLSLSPLLSKLVSGFHFSATGVPCPEQRVMRWAQCLVCLGPWQVLLFAYLSSQPQVKVREVCTSQSQGLWPPTGRALSAPGLRPFWGRTEKLTVLQLQGKPILVNLASDLQPLGTPGLIRTLRFLGFPWKSSG